MSDRKTELLSELRAVMERMGELLLEAKSLGIAEDDMERVLGPVMARFDEAFRD